MSGQQRKGLKLGIFRAKALSPKKIIASSLFLFKIDCEKAYICLYITFLNYLRKLSNTYSPKKDFQNI